MPVGSPLSKAKAGAVQRYEATTAKRWYPDPTIESPPPGILGDPSHEEAWASACAHKRRSAQKRRKGMARQWPRRPEVPFCHNECNTKTTRG